MINKIFLAMNVRVNVTCLLMIEPVSWLNTKLTQCTVSKKAKHPICLYYLVVF